MDSIISVQNLSKIYRLYQQPIDRLKETVLPWKKNLHRDFYALNDVSFDVHRGETVGIIGVNGSGKSTILKIITGVLSPTSGHMHINGRISALLELGAGFNPDYTGIENVYLNGTMMGYSREEMDRKLPEILRFADIGEFVHQPVKTYSSGMYVRLAFAIAINVEPEILIVDEALSVGDVFFQAKCYKKINEIKDSGTTILLVTHDMSSVLKYCDKVVLLNKGKMIREGDPAAVVDLYKKILAGQYDPERDSLEKDSIEQAADGETGSETEPAAKTVPEPEAKAEPEAGPEPETKAEPQIVPEDLPETSEPWQNRMIHNPNTVEYGDGKAQILDFGLFDKENRLSNMLFKGDWFTVRMKVRFDAEVDAPIMAFTIKDRHGQEITGTNTMIEDCSPEAGLPGQVYVASFTQKLTLQGGEYLLSLGCTGYENGEFVVHHRLYDVTEVAVVSDKNTVGYYDCESRVRVEEVHP